MSKTLNKPKKTSKLSLPLAESPDEASKDRAACQKCGLFTTCKSPFIRAYVPPGWTGKLLIWGEGPGKNEDDSARPFVGRAGEILFAALEAAGFSRLDVALTYSVRCRPISNAAPGLNQIRYCRPFAVYEVLSLRPKLVLGVGDSAAKSITNSGNVRVPKLRQRALDGGLFFGEAGKGIRVAFTYHPASALYADGKIRKRQLEEDLFWLASFRGYVDEPKDERPIIGSGVALDIEWGANYNLLTVGEAWEGSAQATEDPQEMASWLEELSLSGMEPIIIGHSIFGDLPVIRLNGHRISSEHISGRKVLDSLLLARLRDENRGPGFYDLESLSVSWCGTEPWKYESNLFKAGKKNVDFSTIPPDIRIARCRRDAWASELVAKSSIKGTDVRVIKFSHRLAAALKRVELAGIKISEPVYVSLKKIVEEKLDERATKLKELAAEYAYTDFSPTNDNHFRDLLYNRIGAEPIKETDSDLPSIGKDALILLYQRGSEVIKNAVALRLRYEKAEKLYTTYIGRSDDEGGKKESGLASRLSKGFYVFQRINPLGARTGRRSSSRPNMQNWPKRMRSMVVSRYGVRGQIVKGDESQLEPRILAHVAGIEEWQEIFDKGGNLYLNAAKRLWNREVEKDTTLYKLTKSTILGTNYGMEPPLFIEKMSTEQGIHLTLQEGAEILQKYHTAYPQLPRFFLIQKERLLRNQQVSTLTGQLRRLPCPQGEKTPGFKHLWNQAVNFPIQGTAAYITGSALMDMETAILNHIGLSLEDHYDNLVRFWGLENLQISLDNPLYHDILKMGREIDYPLIINEVHDELVLDVPDKDLVWVPELLQEVMCKTPTLTQYWPELRKLKLKAEISVAPSWAA